MENERLRGNDIGPTGRTVAFNLKRLRRQAGVDLRKLADALADSTIGRPISASGLSKVENGTRRVDVDDLMALSAALNVNPHALLLPATESAGLQADVTGAGWVDARRLWQWARGESPLKPSESRPTWLDDSTLTPNQIRDEIRRAQQIDAEDFQARVRPRSADVGPGIRVLRESVDQPDDPRAATRYEFYEKPVTDLGDDE